MPIANAVQRRSAVFVYDEKGRQLCALPCGTGPQDGLTGYTGNTVNIRRGNSIFTYNEKGQQISITPAR